MVVKFVQYDKKLLDLSWQWLNDPEIKLLTDTKDFSKKQQKEWFDSLSKRNDYFVWGVTYEKNPVGVAGIKGIQNGSAYVFWYIGNKDYMGKGIGSIIASEVSKKAKELGLLSIYAESIFENFRSINLLFKEGYKIDSIGNRTYTLKKVLI